MKIANPKIEVPDTCEMNDKDYITRVLTYLKDIEKNYAIALTEASNEYLYKIYFTHFDKISKMQREVYEHMFANGWYEMQTAKTSDIESKFNMLRQELSSLDK